MMKRVLVLMLASALVLSMTGCGKKTDKTADTPSQETVKEEEKTESGETAEQSGEVTVEDTAQDAQDTGAAGEEITEVTDLLGTAALQEFAGRQVAVKGVTSVDTEDPGGDLLRYLYDTDGNGDPGDDLYFSVEKDGEIYLMVVEGELYTGAEDGGVYQTVESLEEDQVIDLEGILYTDGGPVIHVTDVTVQ